METQKPPTGISRLFYLAKKYNLSSIGYEYFDPRKLLSAPELYHRWYYNNEVWKGVTYRGITTWKSVGDLWNYQEIINQLRPALIIEFGSAYGGSAVYFRDCMRNMGLKPNVFSVDLSHELIKPELFNEPNIEFLQSSSTEPLVADRIRKLRAENPGPVFCILDSDHRCHHVLGEMKLLRPVLTKGDYLIVEDSNINGHPVRLMHGPGPYEAVQKYEKEFPNDYRHDEEREHKFGFTFAPYGFLIRN